MTPALVPTVEGHIAPLSERAAGGDFQWSWQHGAWQRHLKSSMLKKLFPVPYISKQVSAECLGIVPGPSWAPTSVCLVHNGQTHATAEPHWGRGIVAGQWEGRGRYLFCGKMRAPLDGKCKERGGRNPRCRLCSGISNRGRHHTPRVWKL